MNQATARRDILRNTRYSCRSYRTPYRVPIGRFPNMFPGNWFWLIGLTWGESDESEILRPKREEKGENRAEKGRTSPINVGANGQG